MTREEVQYDPLGLVFGPVVIRQDEMAWIGQGPVSDRTMEHLVTSEADPTNWTVNQLASLGGTGANARKFLSQPDVIPADPTNNFDSLLLGSGDREHPFDTAIQNRYYMIKDDHGLTATPSTPITEGTAGSTTGVAGQLYDATSDLVQVGTAAQVAAAKTALATASGWYVTLASGEKVVGGSTTLAGT